MAITLKMKCFTCPLIGLHHARTLQALDTLLIPLLTYVPGTPERPAQLAKAVSQALGLRVDVVLHRINHLEKMLARGKDEANAKTPIEPRTAREQAEQEMDGFLAHLMENIFGVPQGAMPGFHVIRL